MMQISDLTPGDRVRLLSFGNTQATYKRRLLSLGLTCNVEFSIVRRAPLGCPLQIEVRGTFLSLRKEEAKELVLERV